jgi:hypothetical protein
MKLSLAGGSMLIFVLCVALLAGLTLLESALAGMSFGAQRLVTLLGLVVPAIFGAGLGVMSLVRREGRMWFAVAGVVLNTLFALFHLAIILFAG